MTAKPTSLSGALLARKGAASPAKDRKDEPAAADVQAPPPPSARKDPPFAAKSKTDATGAKPKAGTADKSISAGGGTVAANPAKVSANTPAKSPGTSQVSDAGKGKAGAVRGRRILPVAALGLLVVAVGVLWSGNEPTPESEALLAPANPAQVSPNVADASAPLFGNRRQAAGGAPAGADTAAERGEAAPVDAPPPVVAAAPADLAPPPPVVAAAPADLAPPPGADELAVRRPRVAAPAPDLAAMPARDEDAPLANIPRAPVAPPPADALIIAGAEPGVAVSVDVAAPEAEAEAEVAAAETPAVDAPVPSPPIAVVPPPPAAEDVPPLAENEAAPAPMVAAAAPATGGFAVQFSSFRTEEQAQRDLDRLTADFSEIVGFGGLSIVRADLGERGIYYRVVTAGKSGSASAAELCEKVKAQNQDCIVVRR